MEGNRYFREIAAAYPDMKFVLNLRKKEAWLKSRMNFNDYPDRWKAFHGIDNEALVDMWTSQWDRHIAAVMSELPPNRLLVMDIDAPDEAAITAFFGLKGIAGFRQRNKSVAGPVAKRMQKLLPIWLLSLIPNKLKNAHKDI